MIRMPSREFQRRSASGARNAFIKKRASETLVKPHHDTSANLVRGLVCARQNSPSISELQRIARTPTVPAELTEQPHEFYGCQKIS